MPFFTNAAVSTLWLSGSEGESPSSDGSGDTDDETNRQVAAERMNRSQSNPDRRHQTEEGGAGGTQPRSGDQEEEEDDDSGDDERKCVCLLHV